MGERFFFLPTDIVNWENNLLLLWVFPMRWMGTR